MKSPLKSILSWLLPLLVILGVFFGLQHGQKNQNDGPDFPDSPPTVMPNFPEDSPELDTETILIPKKSEEQIQLASAQKDEKAMVDALKRGEVENCKTITRLEMRQNCEDHLNYGTLLQEQNPSQCQRLHSPLLKQSCLDAIAFQRAMENKNRQQCNVIQEALLKNRCLDQLNLSLAQSSSNPSDCESIIDPNQKSLCEDQMDFKIAVKENNPENCQQINNQTLKQQCSNTLQNNQVQTKKAQAANEAVNKNSPVVEGLARCELLIDKARQNCEDTTYFQEAFVQKNLIYCNQIQNKERQIQCRTQQQAAIDQHYYKRALQLGQSTECRLIENKDVETICLENVK